MGAPTTPLNEIKGKNNLEAVGWQIVEEVVAASLKDVAAGHVENTLLKSEPMEGADGSAINLQVSEVDMEFVKPTVENNNGVFIEEVLSSNKDATKETSERKKSEKAGE